MVGKYNVITLCGSTKFKDAYIKAQKELTLKGNIVISVGLFGNSGDNEVWGDGVKEMLDDMHKRKIDMADEIFVINIGGYIGESTKSEIEYAKLQGKKITFLEETPIITNCNSSDEVKDKKPAEDKPIKKKWVRIVEFILFGGFLLYAIYSIAAEMNIIYVIIFILCACAFIPELFRK